MSKCEKCENICTKNNYAEFFNCSYCEELYCKSCHNPKKCLKEYEDFVDEIEKSIAPKDENGKRVLPKVTKKFRFYEPLLISPELGD